METREILIQTEKKCPVKENDMSKNTMTENTLEGNNMCDKKNSKISFNR